MFCLYSIKTAVFYIDMYELRLHKTYINISVFFDDDFSEDDPATGKVSEN